MEKRLTQEGVRLIALESLQWCAVNAVYFLGLIGAATYDLGGDAFLVAGITLVRNLTNSLGNVAAGPIIDDIGPRKCSLATLALYVAAALILGIVPTSVGSLLFAAIVIGLLGGFINTCTRAYPAYLVSDREQLQRLNGLMVFYSNITFGIGPLLGGVLVTRYATRSVFLLMAVLMALAFAVTWGCREQLLPEQSSRADEKTGFVSGLLEGARLTFKSYDLRLIFVSGFLGFFAFGAFDSLESLYYRDVLAVDVTWMGWLSSIVGLASAVGAYLLTRIPQERVNMRMLLASVMAVGVGSIVYVGTGMLAVAIVGQLINGFAWGFLEPVQAMLIQEEAPIEWMGRITGFIRFGLNSAGVIPLLLAPFFASAFGAQTVLLGASFTIAIVGACFYVAYSLRHPEKKASA